MGSNPSRSKRVFVSYSALSLFLAGLSLSAVAKAQNRCEALFPMTTDTTASAPGLPPIRHEELEASSKDRLDWIHEQNRKSGENFKKSPNLKKISQWIHDTYAKESVVKTKKLAEGQTVSLIQRGFGKSEDLVLKTAAGEEILFSSFAPKFDESPMGPKPRVSSFATKRNGNIHFVDFKISNDKRYIALVLEENGSLDKFRIAVYDLKTKSEIVSPSVPLTAEHEDVGWIGSTLYFTKKGGQSFKFDFNNQAAGVVKTETEIIDEKVGVTLFADQKYKIAHGTVITEMSVDPESVRIKSVVGYDSKSLYLEVRGKDKVTTLQKVALPFDGKPRALEAVVTLPFKKITSMQVRENLLLVEESFGPRQTLHVYALDGTELTKMDAPLGTSFVDYSVNKKTGLLDVNLTSNIVPYKTFSYDLTKKTFVLTPEEISAQMLTKDGKEYESLFVETTSSDGVKIPLRITKLKSIPRDGKNPVLMNVYGGFNMASGFYPEYIPLAADFLSRGGIVVDPAIRGGNEFGDAWHESATKHNKTKTLDDLIATSRYLVAQNYTQSRQIVIKGTSNGGFVVAAAGLRSPSDFGLVVAVNGVHDMLRRGTLDTPFDKYWSTEYGNGTNPSDIPFLLAFSPVEQARTAQNLPEFFILNGRNDSRVNPAHSFKLDATLNENAGAGSVQMKSVNNSGHWLESPRYQGLIGWRSSVFTWTAMYDHWGWQR